MSIEDLKGSVFFYDIIKSAQKQLKTYLPESAESYIVFMLNDMATGKRKMPEGTLFDLLEKTQNATKSAKFNHFKELGDKTVLTLSLFEDSIRKNNVSRSYYRDLGKNAYYSAFEISERFAGVSSSEVYIEMHENYDRAVNVIKRAGGLAPLSVVR